MTIQEFRTQYPMGHTTLYRKVKSGEIRLTKFGRSTRIAKAEAERWASSLPTIGGNCSA
ncbi:MAG: helix-turn-helix domain-containing protein [Alphaproteobacteria bacterium]|nr:helix-turn-helix domain-containing protein [Alphaproteobacteria bacterium]